MESRRSPRTASPRFLSAPGSVANCRLTVSPCAYMFSMPVAPLTQGVLSSTCQAA